jgi:DNA-binding GntR family transcriptional regulator
MTVNSRRADRSGTASSGDLSAIADSVRGTFQTVEGMTQSFIREAILQGIYKPGERLNQDAIADALGVSRMPVRASLRQLEAEGLVRIYPHRGATVSVLRPHEIAEIYELRVLIEGHLLELALANLTDDALADLEELVGHLDGDPLVPERLERRKEFYERLYELADRPRALGMAKQLRDSVGRYLLLIRSDELHPHEDLMVHLRSRDNAAAKRWLAAHLKSVSRKLQQVVAQAGDEASH